MIKRPIFPYLKKCHKMEFFKLLFYFFRQAPLLSTDLTLVILPLLNTHASCCPCLIRPLRGPARRWPCHLLEHSLSASSSPLSLSYSPTPVTASSQFFLPVVCVLAKAPFSALFSSLPNPGWPCQFFSQSQRRKPSKIVVRPYFPFLKSFDNSPKLLGSSSASSARKDTGRFDLALDDLPGSLPSCNSSAVGIIRHVICPTYSGISCLCICCFSAWVTLLSFPISLTYKLNHFPHAKLCHTSCFLKDKI